MFGTRADGPPLPAGKPIYFSYGRRANDHLLLEYGFVLEGNEHEEVMVFSPPPGAGAADPRAAARERDVLAREQYVLPPFCLGAGRLSAHLLSYFRALAVAADAPAFARWEAGRLRSLNRPVSAATEEAALAAYEAFAEAHLRAGAGFATTIEQDEAMLAALSAAGASGATGNSGRLELALRYRLTRKRLVRGHGALAGERRALLRRLQAEAAARGAALDDDAALLQQLPPLSGAMGISTGKAAPLPVASSAAAGGGGESGSGASGSEEGIVAGYQLSELSAESSASGSGSGSGGGRRREGTAATAAAAAVGAP